MNSKPRWKQRFQNFEKAFEVLQRRIREYEAQPVSEAYQMALVQRYEIIIESAWKVMKDYLIHEGYDIQTGRQAIRQAFQAGLVQEGETWLQALDHRNLTNHTYDAILLQGTVEFIAKRFYPLVQAFYFRMKTE